MPGGFTGLATNLRNRESRRGWFSTNSGPWGPLVIH